MFIFQVGPITPPGSGPTPGMTREQLEAKVAELTRLSNTQAYRTLRNTVNAHRGDFDGNNAFTPEDITSLNTILQRLTNNTSFTVDTLFTNIANIAARFGNDPRYRGLITQDGISVAFLKRFLPDADKAIADKLDTDGNGVIDAHWDLNPLTGEQTLVSTDKSNLTTWASDPNANPYTLINTIDQNILAFQTEVNFVTRHDLSDSDLDEANTRTDVINQDDLDAFDSYWTAIQGRTTTEAIQILRRKFGLRRAEAERIVGIVNADSTAVNGNQVIDNADREAFRTRVPTPTAPTGDPNPIGSGTSGTSSSTSTTPNPLLGTTGG